MKAGFFVALLMIFTLLAAVACFSSQGTSDPENKSWKLESYGEEGSLKNILEGTEITVTFEGNKAQVGGSAGVNTYSGNYTVNGNRLSISQLSWTEMYRIDPPGIMEQEEQYLKAFQAAESFTIHGSKLRIVAGTQLLIYAEQNSGILQGLVTIGPLKPVEKPGEKPPVPPEVYESRKIMVYDKSGKTLVQQVDINSQGRYVVHLKPGTYTVDINRIGIDSSDDVPKQVEIQLGITTKLDIDIDTGIR